MKKLTCLREQFAMGKLARMYNSLAVPPSKHLARN
jgi:hypothetical protein